MQYKSLVKLKLHIDPKFSIGVLILFVDSCVYSEVDTMYHKFFHFLYLCYQKTVQIMTDVLTNSLGSYCNVW
jgi:hypothetical protein